MTTLSSCLPEDFLIVRPEWLALHDKAALAPAM